MKAFMPDLEAKQRLQLLKDNCDSAEETTYYRELQNDELDVKRESLSDNLVKLSEHEDVLDDAKAVYKEKATPLKLSNKQLLEEIKTRKQKVTGMLYNIADHTAGIMETYDENGDFVSSRRLRPEEKQGKLFIADEKKQAGSTK